MKKDPFPVKLPALPEETEKLVLEVFTAWYKLMDSPLWQPWTVVPRLATMAIVNSYLMTRR